MPSPSFLQSLVELASCETLDALLRHGVALLERELGVRAGIELWDCDGVRFARGEPALANPSPFTWIGIQYTLGAIYLHGGGAKRDDIDLLALQLAPLAERLLEREGAQSRTLRDDVERLYERRIRDALVRNDWNASAVARELVVGRGRVLEVARRWRPR